MSEAPEHIITEPTGRWLRAEPHERGNPQFGIVAYVHADVADRHKRERDMLLGVARHFRDAYEEGLCTCIGDELYSAARSVLAECGEAGE